jgi:hypothetical protein
MIDYPSSGLPEKILPLAPELGFYYRELPRLLEEGKEGLFTIVKDETFHGTWNTFQNALRFARNKFPEGHFLIQKIDHRLLDGLAPFFSE